MKIALLAIFFMSCAPLNRGYKTYAQRMDECLKAYLALDLSPDSAVKLCKQIHGEKNK